MVSQLATREHGACYTLRDIGSGQPFGPAFCNRTDAIRHAALGLAAQPAGFEIVKEMSGLFVVVAIVRPSSAYAA